jgi:hypothetical protein
VKKGPLVNRDDCVIVWRLVHQPALRSRLVEDGVDDAAELGSLPLAQGIEGVADFVA